MVKYKMKLNKRTRQLSIKVKSQYQISEREAYAISKDGIDGLLSFDTEYKKSSFSFIYDMSKVISIEGRAMVNISGKQIREAHLKLKLGDVAVTFSDGIIHAGVGRLLNLGWQHENVVQFLEETWQADDTAYDVQHRLLNECNSLYQGHPGDDTTVAALRICVPNPCCVMVGPPVHPEDDEEVVGELLACPGIKVVCGGTTSQIVSKRLGKELKILLQYISPEVPPIATMEGIDLVTEGVVTLGKTLEILEQYEETKDPELLIAKKDGAHLLAETLVEKCTSVKFIVGRALNPAHQNPDMPISLSIKLRLVKDISECLKRLGKPTTLKYC